ncbi:MAG: RDD family protein [Nocardioides sp.]|nr:RDD family protein [Nocardioides sp.]
MSEYGAPQDHPKQPEEQVVRQPQRPSGPTMPAPTHAPGAGAPVTAQWHLRVGAALIDAVILLPFYLIAGFGGGIMESGNIFAKLLGGLVVAAGWVGFICFGIWNHVIRQGRSGYTVGKGVIGIRLVQADSAHPIGGGRAFWRQVLHFLDTLPCFIGFLWPLWDPQRQTFADKIVGTIVIVERRG